LVPFRPNNVRSLEEYIENTSFGEFESRLNHLLAFYNQFDTELTLGFTRFNYLSEEIRVKIKNTLFNLYNYYKQFVPA
jgi:midasin (ATPase involved in ribosome maturation)